MLGIERLFDQKLKVINIGLADFLEALERFGVEVRQVEPDISEDKDNTKE